MSRPANGQSGPFSVNASGKVGQSLKRLQQRAEAVGRGEEFLTAVKTLHDRLRTDPLGFGEPLYRLPALKLSVRVGGVPPLTVHFGVHESRPLVFIQSVKASPFDD